MATFTARERWVLAATILGSSMVFIDGAAVTLALPQMQATFRADATSTAWVVEGYGLVLGSLMLFGGAMGDKFGRRKLFEIGVALFALASIACGFAWSMPVMNGARVIQGVGGMMLAPASLALLGAQFSGAARGRAIAAWSAFGAITSSIGPAVGGLLVDHIGWRSIFWINVPIAAIVLFATFRYVRESDDESQRGEPLDVPGALAITAGLGALTYAMLTGQQAGWHNPWIVGAAVAAAACIALFFFIESRSENALLPPALFKNRTFAGVNGATFLLYGALGANFYEMPLVLIQGHGYSATLAAFATLPLVVCMVVLARVGSGLRERIGARAVLTGGPVLAGVGFALLGMLEPGGGNYWLTFFPGIAAIGVGLGFTVAPLTATVIDAADERHIGAASGVNNAISRIAGLIAIAGLSIIVWTAFNRTLDATLAGAHLPATVRAQIDRERGRVGGATVRDPQGQAMLTHAFRIGYRDVAYVCALLAFLAALVDLLTIDDAWLSKKRASSKSSEQESPQPG